MSTKHGKYPSGTCYENDDTLQSRARELHIEIFPEEYDQMHDSLSDVRERQRGENPMSVTYVTGTNGRRMLLGFEPFKIDSDQSHQNTYNWVVEKLQLCEEEQLLDIVTLRANEAADSARSHEEARALSQTLTWTDQNIDAMLASNDFWDTDQDRSNPNIIAFRILGQIFKINPSSNSETTFLAQIGRVLPGSTNAEYADLYRYAKNEWMEAYGY